MLTACRDLRHRFGTIVASLAATLLACVSGCSDKPTRVLGSVLEVQYGGDTSQEQTGLLPGHAFGPGADLHLPAAAVATITFVPGIYGRLAGAADLRILNLSVGKNGNEPGPAGMQSRRVALHLTRGHLVAVTAGNPSGSESRLSIEIPGARISASEGATFSINLTAETVRLTCARGEATIAVGHTEQRVTAGHYIDVQTDAVSAEQPAELDSSAQDEVVAILLAEAGVLQLVRSEIRKVRPWLRD